jgi:hypothetical protein
MESNSLANFFQHGRRELLQGFESLSSFREFSDHIRDYQRQVEKVEVSSQELL